MITEKKLNKRKVMQTYIAIELQETLEHVEAMKVDNTCCTRVIATGWLWKISFSLWLSTSIFYTFS